ncbi:hypothetical protein ACFE04_025475 [Oxalis oulophora]
MEQNIIGVLQNCKTIKQLRQTHLQILIHGLHNSNIVIPKLITVSSQLHSLNYATKIFENSITPNVITHNNMIKCFIGNTHKAALRVYIQMKALMLIPNTFTFTFIFRCFSLFDALREGMMIHCEMVKMGFGCNVFVQNSLLEFYSKCGRLCKSGNMELACSVFERMTNRNEITWNSMISGYLKNGRVEDARAIFDQMPEKTVVSWTSLISGYTMIGDLKSAGDIFNQMPVKNVISWNAMISAYIYSRKFDQALSVFNQMLIDGKCRPDQSTLITVVSACSHLGSIEHGKWIDSYIKKNSLDLSVPLSNALIDMFAKCGDVENAKEVFNKMGKKCVISWTTLIWGLAANGHCREALNIFDSMCSEKVKPDDVVFIAVLTACSHGGMVNEGQRVFDQMVRDFDIKPRIEHYGCMVDLLGRAGKLEEAMRFIEKEMHLKPNAVIWATMLGSCKIHGNGELLDMVTKKILDQEPSNSNYLALISNLSASVGQWGNALKFRSEMRQQGIEKVPGCSSIQVGNSVHEFLARDTSHERRKDIYDVLDNLNGHLRSISDTEKYNLNGLNRC